MRIKTFTSCFFWTIILIVLSIVPTLIYAQKDYSIEVINYIKATSMLISILVAFIYIVIKRQKITTIGFTVIEKNVWKNTLYYIPLILSVIPLVWYGFKNQSSSIYVSIVIYSLFYSLSQEIYFRGIILNKLRDNFSVNKSIIISSLLFSIASLVSSYPFNDSFTQTLLFINTFVFGLIAGFLILLSKTIYPIIIWHFIYKFIILSSCAALDNLIIAYTIQSIVLIIYLIFLFARTYYLKNKSK